MPKLKLDRVLESKHYLVLSQNTKQSLCMILQMKVVMLMLGVMLCHIRLIQSSAFDCVSVCLELYKSFVLSFENTSCDTLKANANAH